MTRPLEHARAGVSRERGAPLRRRPRPDRRVGRGARPRSTSRPAADTSRAGSARPGSTVVTVDPAPGMEPDVISRAEHLPFADGELRRRRDAGSRRITSPTCRRPSTRWRACRATSCSSSTTSIATTPSRRRSGSAIRRTSATTARRSGAGSSRRAGLDVEAVELVDTDIDARGVARPRRLRGRGGRARQGSCSPTAFATGALGDDADRAQRAQGATG